MNALAILGRESEAKRRDARRATAFTVDHFAAAFPSVAPLFAASQNLDVCVAAPAWRRQRGAPRAVSMGERSVPNSGEPPHLTLAERMRRGMLDAPRSTRPPLAADPPAQQDQPVQPAPPSSQAAGAGLLLAALGEAPAAPAPVRKPDAPGARVNGYGARGRSAFRGRGRDPYERVIASSSDASASSTSEDESNHGDVVVSEVHAPALELGQRRLIIDPGTPSTRNSLRALRSIATAAARLTLHRDRDPALGRDVTAALYADVVEAACARLSAAAAESFELLITEAAPGAVAAAGGIGSAPTQLVAHALSAALPAFAGEARAFTSIEAARAAVEECMPPFTLIEDEGAFLARAAACVHSIAAAGLLRPAVALASDGFAALLPGDGAAARTVPPFLSSSMDHATCAISLAAAAAPCAAEDTTGGSDGIEGALRAVHGYAGAPRHRLWWWDALGAVEAFRWAVVGAIIAQCALPGAAATAPSPDRVAEISPECTRRWSPMPMIAKYVARRGAGDAAEVGAVNLCEIVTPADAAVFTAGSGIALDDPAVIARWAAYRVVAALLLEALMR